MMESTPKNKARLCPLTSIPVEGAMGFKLDLHGVSRDIFVVRQKEGVYAYVNSCPHTGVSLDWQPNQFLDNSGTLIQCSTHGALFRIEDGLCIHGPCVNQSLVRIHTELTEGELFLLL